MLSRINTSAITNALSNRLNRVNVSRGLGRLFRKNLTKVPTRLNTNFHKITPRICRVNKARRIKEGLSSRVTRERTKISSSRLKVGTLSSTLLILILTSRLRLSTCVLRNMMTRITRKILRAHNSSRIFKLLILRRRPRTLCVILNVTPITRQKRITRMRLVLLTLNSTYDDRYGLTNSRNLTATLTLIVRGSAQTTRRTVNLTMLLRGPIAM